MIKLDQVDGGVAATFVDGPKQGHVGVVSTDRDGAPPAHMTFLNGTLVYVRGTPRKIRAHNLDAGRRQEYLGIGYRMDPDCPFAKKVAQADAEAATQGEVLR